MRGSHRNRGGSCGPIRDSCEARCTAGRREVLRSIGLTVDACAQAAPLRQVAEVLNRFWCRYTNDGCIRSTLCEFDPSVYSPVPLLFGELARAKAEYEALPSGRLSLLEIVRSIVPDDVIAMYDLHHGSTIQNALHAVVRERRSSKWSWRAIAELRALLCLCAEKSVVAALLAQPEIASSCSPSKSPDAANFARLESDAQAAVQTSVHDILEASTYYEDEHDGKGGAFEDLEEQVPPEGVVVDSRHRDVDDVGHAADCTQVDDRGEWIPGAELHVDRESLFDQNRGGHLQSVQTPLETFLSLWCSVENLVEEMNRYARWRRARSVLSSFFAWLSLQRRHRKHRLPVLPFRLSDALRRRKWVPVNVKELRIFFGLQILYSADAKAVDHRDWWNRDSAAFWRVAVETMSRDRFDEISRNLHLCDPLEEIRCVFLDYDPLFKIRKFADTLFSQFNRVYTAEQVLSVDDVMVKFTGRWNVTISNPGQR